MYVRGDGDNALNDWLPSYNGASGYFGAGYPTATWAAVMKRDLVGVPEETFPPPANVTGDPPETGHSPYTAAATAPDVPAHDVVGTDVQCADQRADLVGAATPSSRRRATGRRPHPQRDVPLLTPPSSSSPGGGGSASAKRSTRAPAPAAGDGLPRAVVVTDEGDDRGTAVRPTSDDPLVAALSHGVGGPVGSRAGHHPWWTPVRVILVLTAICFALGMVQKAPCYHAKWTNSQSRYSEMCYSDLPYLYVGRGFAELDWPYSDSPDVRDRYDVIEYPVGIAYYAFGAAEVTHWLSGSPNLAAAWRDVAGRAVLRPERAQRESLIFTTVNVVGLRDLRARSRRGCSPGVNRRRPWDAALFAVSPVFVLEGLINWDFLAVVCVAGALWAQARGPAGLDRVRHRAGHRPEALPAVPARRALRDLGSRAPLA